MHKPARVQIIVSLGLLVATELIYRLFPVEGYNLPFVANANFGTWLDIQYGGEDFRGHWVSFNAIPTTAHSIWGVLAGQLLMSQRTARQKLRVLLIAGAIGVVAGYALNPVTPIIKRISTSSFVIVSGGWTFLTLAFSFWLIDMMKQQKWSIFFRVIGLNPLFIYLFGHVGGAVLIESILHPFTYLLFGWAGDLTAAIITSALVLLTMWYICQWLHKNKIYIRI
jgi:predicted acyltransferase